MLGQMGLGLSLASAAIVAITCVTATTVSEPVSEAYKMLSDHTPWAWAISLVLAVAAAGAVALVSRLVAKARPSHVLVACVAVSLVASVAWVTAQDARHTVFADAMNLLVGAEGIVRGDPGFQPVIDGEVWPTEMMPEYLSHYPFQSGMLLYYVAMFRIFGAGNLLALQYAGVIANEVALVGLYAIGRHLLADDRQRNLLTVMLTAFLPFWMLACFPYGNSVGFGLAVAFLACQVEAMASQTRKGTTLWSLASMPLLALALTVKSTFLLVGLAVVAVWIIQALSARRVLGLALGAASIVLATTVTGTEVGIAERMVGAEFGDGIPKVSWLMLGLTESDFFAGMGYDMPGFWDGEPYDVYEETGGDIDEQSEYARKRIGESLSEMAGDPQYAMRFFSRKLASEWAEPTYQTVIYAAYNLDGDGNAFGVSADGDYWMYVPRLCLVFAYDGFQSVVSVLSVIGIASAMREWWRRQRDGWDGWKAASLSVCASFCVGFLCYLLWEAKAVYTLPFFVMLLPMAAVGYGSVSEWVARRLPKAEPAE